MGGHHGRVTLLSPFIIPCELLDGNTSAKIILSFFFFWLCRAACRILVPWPGIKPVPPPAVEAWSLNHWTAREFPYTHFKARK